MTFTEIWDFNKIFIFFALSIVISCSSNNSNEDKVLSDNIKFSDTLHIDSSRINMEQAFHPNLIEIIDSLISWQEIGESDSSKWYADIMCMYLLKKDDDKMRFIITSSQDYEYDGPQGWIEYRDYLLVYFDMLDCKDDDLINFNQLDTIEPDERYFYRGFNYTGFTLEYDIDSSNNFIFLGPDEWIDYLLNNDVN